MTRPAANSAGCDARRAFSLDDAAAIYIGLYDPVKSCDTATEARCRRPRRASWRHRAPVSSRTTSRGQSSCAARSGSTRCWAPHVRDRLGYLAGSDADRLADLNAALRDPAIDAVWCIRGGYGMTRILEDVDFAALRKRPKAIIGYSDITALLNGALQEAGVVTFHGPTARNPMPEFSLRHFERVLRNARAGRPTRATAAAGRSAGRAREPHRHAARGRGGGSAGRRQPDAAPVPHRNAILPRPDRRDPLPRGRGRGALPGGPHARALPRGRCARASSPACWSGRFTEMKRETGDGAFGFDEVLAHVLRRPRHSGGVRLPGRTHRSISGRCPSACARGSMPPTVKWTCSRRR